MKRSKRSSLKKGGAENSHEDQKPHHKKIEDARDAKTRSAEGGALRNFTQYESVERGGGHWKKPPLVAKKKLDFNNSKRMQKHIRGFGK